MATFQLPLAQVLFNQQQDMQFGLQSPQIGYMNKYIYVSGPTTLFNNQLQSVNPWICFGLKGYMSKKRPHALVPLNSINFGISAGKVNNPQSLQTMTTALNWLRPLHSKFRCKLIANQKDVYTKTPTRLKCGDKKLMSRLFVDSQMNLHFDNLNDVVLFQNEWQDFLNTLHTTTVLQ
jgi:hypothetical protein